MAEQIKNTTLVWWHFEYVKEFTHSLRASQIRVTELLQYKCQPHHVGGETAHTLREASKQKRWKRKLLNDGNRVELHKRWMNNKVNIWESDGAA